jgi:SAM-dependent methyltransferase
MSTGDALLPAAWMPHGLALLDHLRGRRPASVRVVGEDGEEEWVDASVFFRGAADFSALEEAALELCRGRILDAGAGAGAHSLVLQERGLEVVAIDVSPEAVEVMRLRGVRDARCADVFSFPETGFDTLLLLMNGIGVVQTVPGLDRFFRRLPGLLRPRGQVILDSYDPRPDALPGGRRYPGEMRFRLQYGERAGPFYGWLFLDLDTLRSRAGAAGLACEEIWQEEEGHYLARLTAVPRMAGN